VKMEFPFSTHCPTLILCHHAFPPILVQDANREAIQGLTIRALSSERQLQSASDSITAAQHRAAYLQASPARTPQTKKVLSRARSNHSTRIYILLWQPPFPRPSREYCNTVNVG
jgi:hypothetical protein